MTIAPFKFSAVGVAFVTVVVGACRTGAPVPPGTSGEALRAACSHQSVSAASRVTLYQDAQGRVQRLAITPDSTRLADHGRGVFDAQGKYLDAEPTSGGEEAPDSVLKAQQAAREKLIPPGLKEHDAGTCADY